MLQLRLSTTHERKNIIVERTQTPKQVLDSEDVILDGATVNLDGIPLSYQEMNTSFDELGAGDTATLSVVVKTGNA
jgi:hypothetical protein